jgi:hypothetical protein
MNETRGCHEARYIGHGFIFSKVRVPYPYLSLVFCSAHCHLQQLQTKPTLHQGVGTFSAEGHAFTV